MFYLITLISRIRYFKLESAVTIKCEIVTATIVKQYRNVVVHEAFWVTIVMLGSDVIVCNVIVICDFAVDGYNRVEWTGLSVANAAYQSIDVVHLLLTRKKFYFAVLFDDLEFVSRGVNRAEISGPARKILFSARPGPARPAINVL